MSFNNIFRLILAMIMSKAVSYTHLDVYKRQVYIQAEAPYREHKDNINLFFVKASNGAIVPLTSLGNASYTTGPGSIKRFNMFTTAVIRGAAAVSYTHL